MKALWNTINSSYLLALLFHYSFIIIVIITDTLRTENFDLNMTYEI